MNYLISQIRQIKQQVKEINKQIPLMKKQIKVISQNVLKLDKQMPQIKERLGRLQQNQQIIFRKIQINSEQNNEPLRRNIIYRSPPTGYRYINFEEQEHPRPTTAPKRKFQIDQLNIRNNQQTFRKILESNLQYLQKMKESFNNVQLDTFLDILKMYKLPSKFQFEVLESVLQCQPNLNEKLDCDYKILGYLIYFMRMKGYVDLQKQIQFYKLKLRKENVQAFIEKIFKKLRNFKFSNGQSQALNLINTILKQINFTLQMGFSNVYKYLISMIFKIKYLSMSQISENYIQYCLYAIVYCILKDSKYKLALPAIIRLSKLNEVEFLQIVAEVQQSNQNI